MRVTAKLVVAFVLGMIAVTGISIWWVSVRETEEFHRAAHEEARRQGVFLEDFVATIWRTQGHEGVLHFLESYQLSLDNLRVRWVWFDADTERQQQAGVGQYVPVALNEIQRLPPKHSQPIVVREATAEYVCHYWPVRVPGDRKGGLEIAKPMTALANVKGDLIKQVLMWMGSSILASGILMAYIGMRFVGRPLKEMARRTHEIAAGNLAVRVEAESNDELGQLAKSFNVMCGKLKASQERAAVESEARLSAMEQLRHADRLQTVGRLAAGVAHELGTPLNVVAGRAQLIASGKLREEEVVSSAATIQHQAGRMTSIIRQLLDFARRRTPQRTWVDLRNVVDQTTTLLDSLARKNNTTITVKRLDKPCRAEIDVGQIEQVLTNLVVNAIQSMPDGGQVEVELSRRCLPSPNQPGTLTTDYACVAICDDGTGIAAEYMPHLFEPFFTTKSFGDGTGLGLSISYNIVQEHGGYIDVQSKPGEGSCFTVVLPVGDAE